MTSKQRRKRSWIGILVSIALLAALIVYSILHVGEARRFARLLERSEPGWILPAVAFQIATYVCAGAIWGRVAAAAGYRLPIRSLARLAVEKLSVDQFVPAGGMAGNVVVIGAMHRMGLPSAVAAEALLVDILSTYAALATAGVVALLVLLFHHDVTPLIVGILAVFAVLVAAIPLGIVWLLKHRSWKPGRRLSRFRIVMRVHEALAEVKPERVRNPRLLATAALLQMGIFVLDAATLWAMLEALGTPGHPLTAFVAVVMATIAATITVLPGGIGSFEAASTATLALLGTPVEAALTGTLLMRGLTLWLPLLPGTLLARRDLYR